MIPDMKQSSSINKMGEGLKSSLEDSQMWNRIIFVSCWMYVSTARKWLLLVSSAGFASKRTKQRRLWTRLEVFIESQAETYTTIPYCSGHPTRTNNKRNWVKNDFASSSQFLNPPLVFTSHTSCLPVMFLSLKISHHKCPDSIDAVSSGFMAESLRFWIVQYKWLHGHRIIKTTTNKQKTLQTFKLTFLNTRKYIFYYYEWLYQPITENTLKLIALIVFAW